MAEVVDDLSLYLNTQREKCMYMLAGFYVQPEPIANVGAGVSLVAFAFRLLPF